jgi:hypothetical protein
VSIATKPSALAVPSFLAPLYSSASRYFFAIVSTVVIASALLMVATSRNESTLPVETGEESRS